MCGTQVQKKFFGDFSAPVGEFSISRFRVFALLQLRGRYYRPVSDAFSNRLRTKKRITNAYRIAQIRILLKRHTVVQREQKTQLPTAFAIINAR